MYVTFLCDIIIQRENRLLVARDEERRQREVTVAIKGYHKGSLWLKLLCILNFGGSHTCDLHRTHTQTDECM